MGALISSFIAGLIFGVGLLVSGMANPAKVLGFLDLAGAWDPSLALVMGGAIGVASVAFAFIIRRGRTLSDAPLQLPTATQIDRRLVVGSLMFGVGWGLAGFCPGPAIVAVGLMQTKAVIFTLAMLAGMAIFEWLDARRAAAIRGR
jgi:uncharacterized membrane protein YedE/YeeE